MGAKTKTASKNGVKNEVSRKLLTYEQIPKFYRESYILSGYRPLYSSFFKCFTYLFQRTNETLNFWSHFLPSAYFAIGFIQFFSTRDGSDPYLYPMIVNAIGSCSFLGISSLAHLFCCMSPNIRHICYYMDYAGICFYSICGGISYLYFARPILPEEDDWFYQNRLLFVSVSIMVSTVICFFTCLSRHKWLKIRYLFRTLAFTVPFCYNTLPLFYRILSCPENNYNQPALRYYYLHWFWYAMSAVANVSRLPECISPGRFDIVGHSHQWFHLFLALGTDAFIKGIRHDCIHRQDQLLASGVPDLSTSIGMAILGLCCLVAVVAFYGILLHNGNFTEQTDESKPHNSIQDKKIH